ncbi:MAG: hypothetical protein WDN45_03680 [Caulobacteraceae bacterium]
MPHVRCAGEGGGRAGHGAGRQRSRRNRRHRHRRDPLGLVRAAGEPADPAAGHERAEGAEPAARRQRRLDRRARPQRTVDDVAGARLQFHPPRLHARRHAARRRRLQQLQRPHHQPRPDLRQPRPRRPGHRHRRPRHRLHQQPRRRGDLHLQRPAQGVRRRDQRDLRQRRRPPHLRPLRHRRAQRLRRLCVRPLHLAGPVREPGRRQAFHRGPVQRQGDLQLRPRPDHRLRRHLAHQPGRRRLHLQGHHQPRRLDVGRLCAGLEHLSHPRRLPVPGHADQVRQSRGPGKGRRRHLHQRPDPA